MDNAPEPTPQIAFGKPCKFFQWEWPNTPNRYGHNLTIDVEWTPCNGAVEIETLSIAGYAMTDAFEQVGILSDLSEKIEAAILAKISDL